MDQLIVIVGITGVQGGSVATTYLQTPGWKIRGITRNPQSDSAQKWASKGVEIVQGDLDDKASLERAFKGADVIFGVTDFWTIFQDKANVVKKAPDQELIAYCHDVELQQGKNLADAAAAVLGLKRYIFSSMANATESSKGKYTRLYHMNSKAKAVAYAQQLAGLKGKFSQVQAPIYMNLPWQWGLPTTPKRAPDGSWRMLVIGPKDKGIPFGDVAADYGRCVKAAAESEPNLNLFAVGDYVPWERYLKTFCESQGLKFGGVDEATYDQFCELLPGGLGHEFAHNVLFSHEFGYEGTDPNVIRPGKLNIKMTTFEEYCRKTDFSAIL